MIGGATGDDIELGNAFHVLRRQLDVVQHHPIVPDPGPDGLTDRLGLLHDLLEHKVLISALFRVRDVPVHNAVFLLHWAPQGIVDRDSLPGQHGDLAVLHVGDLPGILDQGGDVAGQHVEPVAVAQHQRAVLPGGDQLFRVLGADDAQAVGPLDSVEHFLHRIQDIPLIVIVQQLGHYFRICLGVEVNALCLQKLLDFHVVLNDAVVDHGDAARVTEKRMGVHI